MAIRLEQEVKLTYANRWMPWKQELVGERGVVLEAGERVSLVDFDAWWLDDPVWCANESLEVRSV